MALDLGLGFALVFSLTALLCQCYQGQLSCFAQSRGETSSTGLFSRVLLNRRKQATWHCYCPWTLLRAPHNSAQRAEAWEVLALLLLPLPLP